MAVVSEFWSRRQWQPGRGARREFLVTDVSTEAEALAACNVAVGSTFPTDASLVVPRGGISVTTPEGPRAYHVEVDYQYQRHPGIELPDPQNDVLIEPDWATSDRPIERNIRGAPIRNSAGQPFDPPVRDVHNDLLFRITRTESAYDVAKALAYNNTINADEVTIPLIGRFLPGQLKLHIYRPLEPISLRATQVRVGYFFEARPYYELSGGVRVSGFAIRLLDAGTMGYYDDKGTIRSGPIIFRRDSATADPQSSETQVMSPVRLNGRGFPLDDKFWVYRSDAKRAEIEMGASSLEAIERQIDGVWLYHIVNRSMPFSGLNLPKL